MASWENWAQFVKFAVVGASGYVVNLAVYALLLQKAGLHYIPAATGSFLVAVTWNYWWNRTWTFRAQRGHIGIQGMRFLTVSVCVYAANVGVLAALVSGGAGKIAAQAVAVITVTPLNFLGNKLWSFRRPKPGTGTNQHISCSRWCSRTAHRRSRNPRAAS